MIALISDIHANFAALCAVCEDIAEQGADRIYCLGDIVGYGAEPQECTDYIMERAAITLMGNHDQALLLGPRHFNPVAAEVIELTRKDMEPQGNEELPDSFEPQRFSCVHHEKDAHCMILSHDKAARWDFLKNLSRMHAEGDAVFVHASVLDPITEYVFPDRYGRYWDTNRMEAMFEKTPWLIFGGHTHMPCAITSDFACLYPQEHEYHLKLDREKKYIVNIGSVGQPRDGDPRSCYVLYDEKEGAITWRRVAYDIDRTIAKVERMCGEQSWCGVRLRFGK